MPNNIFQHIDGDIFIMQTKTRWHLDECAKKSFNHSQSIRFKYK